MTSKEFSLVGAIIKNVGKRNYEKQRKLKPEEYVNHITLEQLQELIKEVEDKKLNHYKNQIIKQNIYDDPINKKRFGKTYTGEGMPLPEIYYNKTLLKQPKVQARLTMGHEMGHAKQATDIRLLTNKLRKIVKDNNITTTKISEIPHLYRKPVQKIAKQLDELKIICKDEENPINEINADKNIVPHLKKLGLSKQDRQAHYYYRKFINDKDIGRYAGKLGDLRYLKDHIFGFSEEDNFVKNNKKLL